MKTTYILPIIGVIGQDFKFSDCLMHLAAAKESESIVLIIDSLGGDLVEGLKMRDAIKDSGKLIIARNSGDIASIAVSLFLTAKKENRFYNPVKGRFLIHNPYIDPSEINFALDSSKLSYLTEEMKGYEKALLKQYVSETNSDESVLRAFMAENKPLTAEQVEALGFANIEKPEFKAVAFINLNNNNNMKKEEFEKKINGLEALIKGFVSLFSAKNLAVQDVNGTEIVIDVETMEQIVEGVSATIAGAPAEGEFVIDGKTFVFEKGILTKIDVPVDEVEALKQENETLKTQIAALEASNEANKTDLENIRTEAAAQVEKITNELVSFKNQYSKDTPPQPLTPSDITPKPQTRHVYKK